MSAPIILAAGGTGGHVFPAEALAQVLVARGHRLMFVTDARGKAYSGTLGALETYRVSSAQMLGRSPLHKAIGVVALGRGTLQARALFKRLAPGAVVGFGGYPSVPAVGAAVWLGLPTLIHEQNAVLGRANRLFAAKVSRIAGAFETIRFLPEGASVVRTGNPVRDTVRALAASPYHAPVPGEPISILILGGSQGARVFTDLLPDAFKALPAEVRARLRLSQQVRPEDMERAQAAYAGSGITVTLKSFFDDVPARMAECQVVIARAGASTVAEASVIGRPALFVPLPSAADDHQTANARALEAAGAAWVLPQSELTASSLAERLLSLFNTPDMLARAAFAAHAWAIPDAADRLADAVEALMTGERFPR